MAGTIGLRPSRSRLRGGNYRGDGEVRHCFAREGMPGKAGQDAIRTVPTNGQKVGNVAFYVVSFGIEPVGQLCDIAQLAFLPLSLEGSSGSLGAKTFEVQLFLLLLIWNSRLTRVDVGKSNALELLLLHMTVSA